VNYYQLKELIFTVGSMEIEARKFDNPSYIWYDRNSFSNLSLDDKGKLLTVLDEVIQNMKSELILVLDDTSKQTELITHLEVLSSITGIFDKIKIPLAQGNETAKRFINVPGFLKGDSDILNPLVTGADQGLLFWNSLNKLSNFINEVFTSSSNVTTANSSPEKAKLLAIVDEIFLNASDNILIVLPNASKQTEMIDSLEILSTTKGMFRNRKSEVKRSNESALRLINNEDFFSVDSTIRETIQSSIKKAYENIKRLIGDRFDPSDPVMLEKLQTGAREGFEFWNNLKKMKNFMNEDGFQNLTTSLSSSELEKRELIEKLENMKKIIRSDFEQIQEYERRRDSLSDIEKSIFEICKTKLIDEDGWTKMLEQEFYIHWIQSIEQQNPVLRNQPFETYMNNCSLLSSEVKKHRELSRIDISKKIESGIIRPVVMNSRGTSSRSISGASMWSNLSNDLEKKRRVLPVRKLVEKYSQIIFNIAPCWLASPEAVASVFPLTRNLFDFIIFDEASQSAVERSLTSLYRGHHIVVMGDEKQLRPFDLFRMDDEEDEEADEELIDESLLSESLLVLAKRTYGCRYLVWHYRSKSQELINFSNHAFYDGHLQVAPNTIRTPTLTPIHWVKCENGLWANRENLREAYAVVNVIENLLIQDEDEESRSIGVITFNDKQRNAILDEIDRRRKSDPTFDELYATAENPQSKNLDDRPFIKNIENVQGDERDIIIFSVGYARDLEGKLRLRFGTLSQEGGENRLNVAISRARQEIIVVSSIEPDELKTDTAKNNGPRRFKDYLRYAKYISEGRNEDVKNILENLNPGFTRNVNLQGNSGDNSVIFESTFEEIVHDRLLMLGYEIVTQVGYSGYKIDLAVVHPDDPSKYILGIECDGAMFHSAKSTRERDVMRQEFLKSRGWNIERIWSTNWWRNPEREIQRIKQRIEILRARTDGNIKKE
jgi:very-short-patch-repair endonuclease